MSNNTTRGLAIGLLASTALATSAMAAQVPPAPGNTTPAATAPTAAQPGASDTPATPIQQQAQDGQGPDNTEIVVTAQKREENLQNVPISIQAIGTRRLDQLNISNFEEYTKQLPSVSFQTVQPGVTVVYMRGVATGGDGNHSGSLPSVGTYLDEQPVTTIGGTLDVHIYDIARIESLAGPQGTLYGASSQAGTIRIITNKPDPNGVSGRLDGEVNTIAHGDFGGKLEGMVNLPVASMAALRVVGFYQRDGGYIDNIFASRQYCGTAIRDADDAIVGCNRDGIAVNNKGLVEKNFNDITTFGGRAALKIDLDDNWTVTPTVLYQNMKSDGSFAVVEGLGDLNTDRFRDEFRDDRFVQAALTIEGKLANWDLTYAGAYLDRKDKSLSDYTDYADAYDQLYSSYGGIANYFYFQDSAGNTIDPRQYIRASDHFKKMSHEVRLASPSDKSTRLLVGAFYQRQSNDIYQNYLVDNLAPLLSVNGRPGTLWLTKQKRVDRDYALFGELSQDFGSKVTATLGARLFRFDNSLFGFFGFGRDPAFVQNGDNDNPPNAAGSTRTGVAGCFTTTGATLRNAQIAGTTTTLIQDGRVSGTPCTNLADFRNGKLVPKSTKDNGVTYRANVQFKPRDGLMFYATYSRGFRPGGINRRAEVPAYKPDYLDNMELGFKTTFAGSAIRLNGAIFSQKWKRFQFSYLGENSFTEIRNGSDARINGVEADINYVGNGLTLNAAATVTDAKTLSNICNAFDDNAACSGSFIAAAKGTRLPITPRFKSTATARYSFPVGGFKSHIQAGVAYQSKASASLRQQITLVGTGERVNPNDYIGAIRASTLVDVAAGIDFHRFTAELFAQNLFDERNQLSRGVACSSCQRPQVVVGSPRTIGLRLGTRF